MASARRDDLARRLAERLDKSPVKGRAMMAAADDVASAQSGAARSSPAPARKRSATTTEARRSKQRAQRSSSPPQRPKRGASGSVLRGHLVPEAVHGDARRRKVALRSTRGERITWDSVMSEGVALLVDQPGRAAAVLDETGDLDAMSARRRLVQATLPDDLDRRLAEIHLDLSDRAVRSVTYEQLWTAAILLWLRATG